MHIELAEERLLLIPDRFTADQAEARAWAKRVDAFKGRTGGIFGGPKDADFHRVHRERRLHPFWRVACSAAYAYERRRDYQIRLTPEVWSVQLPAGEQAVEDGELRVSGLERCRQTPRTVCFFDAITGEVRPELAEYVNFGSTEATERTLAVLAAERAAILPPRTVASTVAREAFAAVVRPLEADQVLEQSIRLEAIDLYYRPVYAFRYRWRTHEAVIEVDALTGATRMGGETFEQLIGRTAAPEAVFDIGQDTTALFLPGLDLTDAVVVSTGEMFEPAARAAF